MDDKDQTGLYNNSAKLSFLNKLGYGLGSSASNFIWQMVSFYLVFFYTDAYIIPAAVAGIILLAVRIFDDANDIFEGYLVLSCINQRKISSIVLDERCV